MTRYIYIHIYILHVGMKYTLNEVMWLIVKEMKESYFDFFL
jgi:hypothetical protein